jgi:hypothetical protein
MALRTIGLTLTVLSSILVACIGGTPPVSDAASQDEWQIDFNIEQRSLANTGQSRYFVLEPGFQVVLESRNEKVTFTVLDETREISGVTTRVVEERAEEFGTVQEVIKSFVAMDRANGDVFKFGEAVEEYRGGRVVSTEGSWMAGVDGGRPGLLVPGEPVVGMKYYVKFSPGIIEDRAEVTSISTALSTPAGDFENGLVTRETSPLEPGASDQKSYAPGVGIVQDGSLRLASYGTVMAGTPPAH